MGAGSEVPCLGEGVAGPGESPSMARFNAS